MLLKKNPFKEATRAERAILQEKGFYLKQSGYELHSMTFTSNIKAFVWETSLP
jgi:hypothetical protein